jgi:hypothetical protein
VNQTGQIAAFQLCFFHGLDTAPGLGRPKSRTNHSWCNSQERRLSAENLGWFRRPAPTNNGMTLAQIRPIVPAESVFRAIRAHAELGKYVIGLNRPKVRHRRHELM